MKEQKYRITIDDVVITVTKKRMKNMYLRVKPEDGSVQISAPYQMSDGAVREFARSHLKWIREHRKQMQMQMETRPSQPSYSEAEIAKRKRLLKEKVWFFIEKWEPQMGVKVSGVTIRHMKTRWGSCNPKICHININLALLEKDDECLEYVVVHEMTHILEASHNAVFWGYMTRFYPDWKRVRAQLNRT